jgi:putative hydrolase of the HAD superfamily
MQPRAVLFDLGGVVCSFSHDARLAALSSASGLSDAEVHRRLFESGFDLACDRGDYTLEQQCVEIGARLGLRCTPLRLAELWSHAFSPDTCVLDIVRQVRRTAETAIFTNNGPLVRLMIAELFPGIVASFDRLCFSYQVKATKPDPHAFLTTLERLDVAPASSVFVDDSETNVLGADRVGIDAIHFLGGPELAQAFRERGLL